MRKRPLTPGMHGLTDYAFGIALLTVPSLLGAGKKTVKIYNVLAAEIFLYGALTKQPYALKPVIPMQIHKKIDVVNLTGLALLSCYKGVKKRKSILAFNLGMVALGVTTVLLTNWKVPNRS